MTITMTDKLVRDGFCRPVYLSLVARATISRHNGTPILESYNPVYHYWATYRDLSRNEVVKYLGETYLRNMK